MQTMEQSLADLVLRGVITQDAALTRTSHAEALLGLIERGVTLGSGRSPQPPSLRVAEA